MKGKSGSQCQPIRYIERVIGHLYFPRVCERLKGSSLGETERRQPRDGGRDDGDRRGGIGSISYRDDRNTEGCRAAEEMEGKEAVAETPSSGTPAAPAGEVMGTPKSSGMAEEEPKEEEACAEMPSFAAPPAHAMGTPKKRARTSDAMKAAAPAKIAVGQVCELMSLPNRSIVDIKSCWVLEVHPLKEVKAKRSVLTVILADSSGVVTCGLWSPVGDRISPILEKAMDECQGNTFPQIELVHVEIITIATWPLMLAKLQSNRQTACCVLGASPVPGIAQWSWRTSTIWAKQAWRHVSVAAYRMWASWTKSHNPIRTAFLVDQCGTALPIVLFGEHAVDTWEEGALPSIFHACSQEGLTSPTEQASGNWWIYSDACVLTMTCPAKTVAIKKVKHIEWGCSGGGLSCQIAGCFKAL